MRTGAVLHEGPEESAQADQRLVGDGRHVRDVPGGVREAPLSRARRRVVLASSPTTERGRPYGFRQLFPPVSGEASIELNPQRTSASFDFADTFDDVARSRRSLEPPGEDKTPNSTGQTLGCLVNI